jgi:hypothetical protein
MVTLEDQGTVDAADDKLVFTPEAGYYNRLYNPALGRFQDLALDGLDPYSGALRDDTYRDRPLADFNYLVEDEWGNQIAGHTTLGINYHEMPTLSTPITIDYAAYNYLVGYEIDMGLNTDTTRPLYFTRTQSTGAHGQLAVDSPYTDADLQFESLIYTSNPGYPAGNVQVNEQGAWTFLEHTGAPKDYTWKGTFGEAEWLLWARDPAGNESERLAMLFGGYGDDGDPNHGPATALPHGSVAKGGYAQTTIPGTGSVEGAVGGQISVITAAPIVLDLDNNGVTLIDTPISVAYFDMAGDGTLRRTGWVDAGDGLLAFDYNGDGRVAEAQEIQFTRYVEDATTDLEGLVAFDTNGDRKLDAGDHAWSAFGVWQDKNGNGQSEAGEFRTLDEMSIASIDLTARGQPEQQGHNRINGTTTYTRADGSEGLAADVALAYEANPAVSILRAVAQNQAQTSADIARQALAFIDAAASFQADPATPPLGFVETVPVNDMVAATAVADPFTGQPSG